MKKLLNVDSNAKTVKGQKRGYLTGVLYLAPAKLSGYEVCPKATEGCRAACLNTAGRAGIIKTGETTNAIQQSRIAKTRWFFQDRDAFMHRLVKDIEALIRKANREGLTPVVRLNGTSDIVWSAVSLPDGRNIFETFPDVQFYDYTKRSNLFGKDLPANYHLTLSLAENNDLDASLALDRGGNVAAVFNRVPAHYTIAGKSYLVVDGDASDLRFLDQPGVIVGLKAKGKARKDTSGFVRQVAA